MKQKFLLIILIIFFSYFIFLNYCKNECHNEFKIPISEDHKSIEGISYVTTSIFTNDYTEFYYYIPVKAIKNKNKITPLMIIVGGYNSRGQDNISKPFRNFADKEGFVLLSPSFISNDLELFFERSYHYPAVWSGKALIHMINKIQDNGFKFSKIYLFGMSAGAQYCLRFTLWHPDLCVASATHANGMLILPEKSNSIKYFVAVGTKDEDYRRKNVLEFYKKAKKLKMSVIYKEYPINHSLSEEQIKDSLNFFKQVRNDNLSN